MRHRDAKCFGSLEVDDEIEFGRLFNRYIGRLFPAQNPVDQFGGAPEQVRKICSVRHQTSREHILPETVYSRQSRS